MSEILQPHKATNRGAHSNDGPMVVRLVGFGYHEPIPNGGQVAEVPSSWYRVLHHVGRSRSPGHNH